MSEASLDEPATIRDVAFAAALAMVTSIRASSIGDSRDSLESVVESLEIAAASTAVELGANAVLTSIAHYIVMLSAI